MNQGIIIIPTYNEAENIVPLLDCITTLPVKFDILIIDDNSPDHTGNLVKEYVGQHGLDGDSSPVRIYLEQRKGKLGLGTAYLHGFRLAIGMHYEYIFEMDADFSHNPEDLLSLFKACATDGFDMAIGSRYITGVNVVNWPMGRVLMS